MAKGFRSSGGRSSGGSKGFSGSRSRGGGYRRSSGSGFIGGLIGGAIGSALFGGGNNNDDDDYVYNDSNNNTTQVVPAQPTRKKCNYCQTEDDINTSKCSSCGSSDFTVIEPSAQFTPQPSAINVNPTTKPPISTSKATHKKRNSALLGGVIFIVVAIFVLSRIFSMFGGCSGFTGNTTHEYNAGTDIRTAYFTFYVDNNIESHSSINLYNYSGRGHDNEVLTAGSNSLFYVITIEIYNHTSYDADFMTSEDFYIKSNTSTAQYELATTKNNIFTVRSLARTLVTVVYELPTDLDDYYLYYIEYDENGNIGDTYKVQLWS